MTTPATPERKISGQTLPFLLNVINDRWDPMVAITTQGAVVPEQMAMPLMKLMIIFTQRSLDSLFLPAGIAC